MYINVIVVVVMVIATAAAENVDESLVVVKELEALQ